MRTILILLIAVFAVASIAAQPVLTNSSNFTVGDSYRMDSYVENSTASPGQAGANITWDFETITGGTFVEGSTAICVDPAGTPFADSAAAIAANICICPVENPDDGAYQYYHSGYNSRELLGIGWFEMGNTSFGTYQGPLKSLMFPFGYGDSYSGNYEYTSYHLDFGYYFMRDSAEVETVADAWGTIKTPIGEFNNVLRLKTTTHVYSWYRYGAGTPWMFMGDFTDVQYSWYLPGMKVPLLVLLEIDYYKDSFYNIEYLAEYSFVTDVKDVESKTNMVFPNPAHNYICVDTGEAEVLYIVLFNQHGKKVLTQAGPTYRVDISSMSPGIYAVLVQTSKGVLQQKLIIQ